MGRRFSQVYGEPGGEEGYRYMKTGVGMNVPVGSSARVPAYISTSQTTYASCR